MHNRRKFVSHSIKFTHCEIESRIQYTGRKNYSDSVRGWNFNVLSWFWSAFRESCYILSVYIIAFQVLLVGRANVTFAGVKLVSMTFQWQYTKTTLPTYTILIHPVLSTSLSDIDRPLLSHPNTQGMLACSRQTSVCLQCKTIVSTWSNFN